MSVVKKNTFLEVKCFHAMVINFYNWWAKACFECLMIENDTIKKMTEETIFSSFLHVEKAYEMHKGKPRKWHWN